MTSPSDKALDETLVQDAEVSAAPLPAASARRALAWEPLLAERGGDETDAAWGEYPGSADDRLTRDRPPHWDDF